MASSEDNNDLLFLEDVLFSQDQPDAVSSKVISMDKDSELPPKYLMRKIFSPHREPPCHFDPAEEKILRRKKVLQSWGISFDEEIKPNKDGIIALLTFETDEDPKEFDRKLCQQVIKSLIKLIGGKGIEAMKYGGLHVLALFNDAATYETFGKLFMNEKTQNINGFKLVEIQAVSIVNPKPCFIELSGTTDDCHSLMDKLSSLLVTFSSKFPYFTLREPTQRGNGGSPNSSPQTKARRLEPEYSNTVPAFSMQMIFTSKAKKNADKLLERIASSGDWCQVTMPQALVEEDEKYFALTDKSELLVAIKQGSPFPGLKIAIFVNNNFDEMERFYTSITGKTPLAYNKIEEGLCLRIFSLSSKLELQLIQHPSIKSSHVSHVALCFAVEDISKLLSEICGGVRNIGEDHWHVTDPDGNSVILYSSLK